MKVYTIIDMQFGSTGKGLLAGYLAMARKPDTVVTAWAPNAGHTFIDENGRKYIHTMLANGVVSPGLKRIMIGPGSILNLDALDAEMHACADHIAKNNVKIYIHENAVIRMPWHVEEENNRVNAIGSTNKGVGAAAIERIRRTPDQPIIIRDTSRKHGIFNRVYVLNPRQYQAILAGSELIQVEGAQGCSLSLYSKFYPYCTSRDVSVAQTMADCAIPFRPGITEYENIGTCRTYPIRVGNRFDETGKQIGWSGPCYDDQVETSFENLGVAVELTTVTKLPRRIFTWSDEQVTDAIYYNGISKVFLNFTNYCGPHENHKIIESIESTCNAKVCWIGKGPAINDVEEVL